ncbi:MAG: sugar ABC transporter permease [Chloroflexi bacterium]|nr:sugar ABC transporter permease [Chloroflexota bacterium]
MTASSATLPRGGRKHFRWLAIQEQITGYLFILPAVLLITIFGLFPIGYAFYMSLHRWRVRKGGFIGLANYEKAIGDWTGALIWIAGFALLALAYYVWNNAFKEESDRRLIAKLLAALILIAAGLAISSGWERMLEAGDEDFLNSLRITLYYALGTVPVEIGLALLLAYILFQQIRGQELFRMIYFLPYITPVVATAVVFRTIFSPRETSLINQLLSLVGLGPYKWLFEPKPFTQVMFGWSLEGFLAGPSMALVSIIFYGIWTYVGYNTVIFLAGLGSIPSELYEAAEIDGANGWQLFRHITLPLLSPVTFYLSLIAFIGTFKAFNHIYVMRMPSAQGTVDTASVTIFDTFYKANQYGYATAEAFLLFLVILGLTLAQNKVFGERVFYG